MCFKTYFRRRFLDRLPNHSTRKSINFGSSIQEQYCKLIYLLKSFI